ncbi:VRR-NUC domain-containing protein [Lewinella sp. W8]|uniref:VRR-NUC domain-containing protein n=1 Tax=Lewinella sp. W8 TaxID=2528208 RepID=UPI0010681CDA|nr:VRR-NUC domain-containing protein [Lewinella sp. W8]MTB53004.1 hypothetical protein [Lewinella sp. W8]
MTKFTEKDLLLKGLVPDGSGGYAKKRKEKNSQAIQSNREAVRAHMAGETLPKAPAKKKNQGESKIQVRCVAWFQAQYRVKYPKHLIAIRNGGRETGDAKQRAIKGARNKAEGVVPGASDLLLAVPSGEYPGLWIELKRPGQYLRKNQREFQEQMRRVGYAATDAKTEEEFQAIVRQYLEEGSLLDIKAYRKSRIKKSRGNV